MIKHSLPPDERPDPGPPNVPETIVAILVVAAVWVIAVFACPWSLP